MRGDGTGITTRIVRALDDAGIEVDRIGVRRPSLDDVFLSLTGHQAAAAPPPDGAAPFAAGQPATTQTATTQQEGAAA